MNEIIKRYNIGMSIINNNQGVKTMLKTIYNKINNMLEKVGYFLIGYKVDIELLITTMRYIKKSVIKNGDDIKAIELVIKSMREEYESLRTYHNNLSIDYRDNSASKLDLLELKNRVDVLAISNELTKDKKAIYKDSANLNDIKNKSTKPSKYNINNIDSIENAINNIIEVKVNNACLLVQYGADITLDKEPQTIREVLQHYINNDDDNKIATLERVNKQYERLLTSDNNYILEEIAKILVPYDNEEYLEKEWGSFNYSNKILVDIVDDINDKFKGFNNIYSDACDDVEIKTHYNAGINLTNERGENNAK